MLTYPIIIQPLILLISRKQNLFLQGCSYKVFAYPDGLWVYYRDFWVELTFMCSMIFLISLFVPV